MKASDHANDRIEPAERCFVCRRPVEFCYCDSVPSVQNQTSIVILQHRRESFHPFNTARIVGQSLQNCKLLVDRNQRLAARFATTELSPSCGLLFPDSDAPDLAHLSADQRPDQLVIIDGTWHQAKTMMREIPRLGELKRYRLSPARPGQYRIRREPTDQALSTIEATVAALKVLEPETAGLHELIGVFDSMISEQLEHPKSGWRRNERRRRGMPNVPRVLTDCLEHIVVAYGDQAKLASDAARAVPVYWVAERLVSGERFACLIENPCLDDQEFVAKIQIGAAATSRPVSIEGFRDAWRAFLRPTDQLAVYQRGTARLLENVKANFCPTILMKSIRIDSQLQRGTLHDFLERKGIKIQATEATRAAQRLADSIAYVRYLNNTEEVLRDAAASDHPA